jgi:S1-C subfamily serine protease
MRRPALILLLALLAAGCDGAGVGGLLAGGATTDHDWRAALDDSRGAVLKVVNDTCNGVASGSGFVYGPHTLITNRHVVAGARSLSVLTQSGNALSVTVADASTVEDLAVVHTTEMLPSALPLAPADAVPGDLVRALGFPLGGPFTATEGRVIDYVSGSMYGHASRILRSSTDIQPGNSGGPLIDTNGRVSGVVFAVDSRNGEALVLPVTRLRVVLRQKVSFAPVRNTC